MKAFYSALLIIAIACCASAQTIFNGSATSAEEGLPGATPSPTPSSKKGAGQAPQGPTIIDSQRMSYDGKTRIAVFTGDDYGVYLKNPQITVYCDKITAYMRKTGAAASPAPKGKPSAAPAAPAKPVAGASGTPAGQSAVQRAIAEGSPDRPVVIVQDKPATKEEEAKHNVGIAQKADYNADTSEIILTGWPRVSDGSHTQIATSKETYMTMNRASGAMHTYGNSRTVLQEQEQPKKTGTDAATPDESPAP